MPILSLFFLVIASCYDVGRSLPMIDRRLMNFVYIYSASYTRKR